MQAGNDNPLTGKTTVPGGSSPGGFGGRKTTVPENPRPYDFRRDAPLSGRGYNSSMRSGEMSAIKADVNRRLSIKSKIANSIEDKLVAGVANKTSELGRNLRSRVMKTPQLEDAEKNYMEKQWAQMGLSDMDIARERDADAAKLRQMIDAQRGIDVQNRRAGKWAAKSAKRAQVRQMVSAQNRAQSSQAIAGIKASVANNVRKSMEKEARKELEKGMNERLNMKQELALKMATYVAGKKATDILVKAAEEMARQAQKGGAIEVVIIAATYIMALVKDISDMPGVIIPGLGWIGGFIFGTIITIFWLLVAGSSHGMLTRWIVKRLMRAFIFFFIDGVPLFGFLPLFLFMNAWNHWDYIKAIKKAEKSLAEINDNIMYIQQDVQRTVNSI
jgi:hypothetical protein